MRSVIVGLSLRTRLLLAVGAVALLALVLADVTVYASLKSYLYRQVDETLQVSDQSVEVAATQPSTPSRSVAGVPPGTGQQPGVPNFCAIGRESAPGMFIEVINSENKAVKGETCAAFTPGSKTYSPKLPTVITGLRKTSADPHEALTYFTVESSSAGGPSFRVRAFRLQGGGLLVVADPISAVSSTLNQLLFLELAVTGGALVVSVLVALWLVRLGLRPLRDVVRTAEAITDGDLIHRVPNANGRTEIGRLAETLNVMLERIQSGFRELQTSESRLRQFVADASHEPRTPIAAVSAYAQLFKYGATQSGDDMERVMSGIERESARMARLVEDLLVLARFDEQRTLEPELVELVGLVTESVDTALIVGPQWPISFKVIDAVEVMGDPVALRQVVDNVLKNVRAHTPPGTPSTVRVRRSDNEAVIEVEDQGPGLTALDSQFVFERFFRADASRSRDTGGSGLGLAIVATITQSHGGRVEVEPGESGGALFRIVLPAVAVSPGLMSPRPGTFERVARGNPEESDDQ
jgi:two-component system, OmpR family, sensor kinase